MSADLRCCGKFSMETHRQPRRPSRPESRENISRPPQSFFQRWTCALHRVPVKTAPGNREKSPLICTNMRRSVIGAGIRGGRFRDGRRSASFLKAIRTLPRDRGEGALTQPSFRRERAVRPPLLDAQPPQVDVLHALSKRYAESVRSRTERNPQVASQDIARSLGQDSQGNPRVGEAGGDGAHRPVPSRRDDSRGARRHRSHGCARPRILGCRGLPARLFAGECADARGDVGAKSLEVAVLGGVGDHPHRSSCAHTVRVAPR